MKGIQYKSVQGKVADVDTGGRTVVFYASAFNNEDSHGDVMMPGCYTKSIQEWGQNGKKRIVHLADHWPDTGHLLSRDLILEQDTFGLKCTSKIVNTTKGNDVLELYKAGAINEHSVGFSLVPGKFKEENGIWYISEVKLYEVSSVVFGANPETPTLDVKSLADLDMNQLEETSNSLLKVLKDGTVSDETFILLELYHKNILTALSIKTTQQEKSTEPETIAPPSPDLVKIFNETINQHLKN